MWIRKDKLSSYDYFQYFRDCADDDVIKLLKIFTDISLDEIQKYEQLSCEQLNPIKELLAFEATKICRGEEEAIKASKRENIINIPVKQNTNVITVLVENGICKSNGEARRLIYGNGVKVDNIIVKEDFIFTKNCQLTIGKKKKISIKIEK